MRRSLMRKLHVLAFALVLCLWQFGYAGEAPPDPAVTTYGAVSSAAPKELGVFAFLVGKWSGTAKSRNSDGTYAEYKFDWIGRYVLDGMAIADEMRVPVAQGGGVQGMSLRFFDPLSKKWIVEFFNFNRAFLRKQVNARVGSVTQDGNVITVNQTGPTGGPGREIYTLLAEDHFTYRMDLMRDDGSTWDVGLVTIDMRREVGP
jgi:hypothetical protein